MTIDLDTEAFGALLRAFRKRASITQEQLARNIGMQRHAIIRWEQGEVLPASKAIVLELGKHLKLDEQETRRLLEVSLTAPSPIWGVPFPRNLVFTGHEDTLELLQRFLSPARSVSLPKLVSLHGLAGVGKTQLALEIAYRCVLEYRAIFWIEAETAERVLSSLERVARLLGLTKDGVVDQQRIIEDVIHWLSTHDKWLLIWDNIEDLDLLQRFLSLSWQGAFLLTTRQQGLSTLARSIEVLPLEEEAALLLLLRRAGMAEHASGPEQIFRLAEQEPATYDAAIQLVELLGGLPLALDQAGAYVEETGCSLSDYLQRYLRQQMFLLEQRGSLATQHPQSVATTFRLSLARVEQEQQVAVDLLRVCALLHAEAIPEELFLEGALHLGPGLAILGDSSLQLDMALAVLRKLSLIQRQRDQHILSLHRLVQVVIREQMKPEEVRLWSQRVVRMMHAVFPEGRAGTWDQGEVETWGKCERYLVQALACISLLAGLEKELPEASALLLKVGRYLVRRTRLREAGSVLEQAIRLGEQYYGDKHPALIPFLVLQGERLWREGKYALAEALNERAKAIEELHPGSPYVQVGEILNNLALLAWEQGKFEQAKSLFHQSLLMQEQQGQPDPLGIASTINNLALLAWKQGKFEQAEPLFQRALQIREQILKPDHPDVAHSLYNLAVLYRDQGRYEQAEPLFQHALRLQEQVLGPEHLLLADTLINLAVLYRNQNHYEQAEPLFQRALQIREQTLGPEHHIVARSLYNLAVLYRDQGRYEQAESLFQRTLHIQRQELGPDHSTVGRSLNGLAVLYREQGKFAQAKPLFEQALHIHEQVFGLEHPEVAASLHDLAILYIKQRNDEQAELLLRRALHIREQYLDSLHPDRARSLTALVQLYRRRGQGERADMLMQQAGAIFEQPFSPDPPSM